MKQLTSLPVRKTFLITRSLSVDNDKNKFYAGRDEDRKIVIIKRFLKEDCFQRERKIQELLAEGQKHENILYALAWSDATRTVTFPYAQGGDVGSLLKKAGKCTLRQAESIMSPLCRALGSIHSKGIVHRDIKPGNLFLQRTGYLSYKVKLSDFDVGWHKDLDHLDEKGMVYGTPYFMAPEVVMGSTDDPRSDIYAAGIVLFKLLTGRFPLTGDSVRSAMNAHLKAPIPNAAQYNEQFIVGIQHVVNRTLAKNSDKRYQRVEELGQELCAVVEEAEMQRKY